MLETNIVHVWARHRSITSLTCNLIFPFFGHFQRFWEFLIFATFLAKIPRSINEVWSQHPGVQKSKNFRNRKNRLKHIRNVLGTIIGHVEVLYTPIHLLTYNLIFSFFGNIHEFRYFAIFAEFPKKIRQNIFQVWLGYLGAQNSQNFKNRENGLKHIGTMLETIIGHVQVL